MLPIVLPKIMNFFYLVKINKLIFFYNLDADVASFNAKIIFLLLF